VPRRDEGQEIREPRDAREPLNLVEIDGSDQLRVAMELLGEIDDDVAVLTACGCFEC
jgi:hypothetical protein